jgi:hypothetical protein
MTNPTIDANGTAHNGKGLAAGGQFAITRADETDPATLVRVTPDKDLGCFPAGTLRTDTGYAALRLGERLATVSENTDGSVTVVAENTLGGAPQTYIRHDVHTETALAEAVLSASLSAELAKNPVLAHAINSVRYLDDYNSVALHLKAANELPERMIVIELAGGATGFGISVHTDDNAGANVSNPEWCLDHGTGPDSTHRVAKNVVDLVDVVDDHAMSIEDADDQIAAEFANQILSPLMRLKAHELPDGLNLSHQVRLEKDPRISFGSWHRRGEAELTDEERAESARDAVDDLQRLMFQSQRARGVDDEYKSGELIGYATAIAAVRLAGENPTAQRFETERTRIVRQAITGDEPAMPDGDTVTPDRIERAASIMLRATQRDLHLRGLDRTGITSAETILQMVDSLEKQADFTGGTTPRGSVSRLIHGMALSNDVLLDPDPRHEITPISSPRLKPAFGIWS